MPQETKSQVETAKFTDDQSAQVKTGIESKAKEVKGSPEVKMGEMKEKVETAGEGAKAAKGNQAVTRDAVVNKANDIKDTADNDIEGVYAAKDAFREKVTAHDEDEGVTTDEGTASEDRTILEESKCETRRTKEATGKVKQRKEEIKDNASQAKVALKDIVKETNGSAKELKNNTSEAVEDSKKSAKNIKRQDKREAKKQKDKAESAKETIENKSADTKEVFFDAVENITDKVDETKGVVTFC